MIPKFILTIVPFFSRLLPILNYCILLKSAVKLPGDVGSNYFIFVNFREDHGFDERKDHQGQQRGARWGRESHLSGEFFLISKCSNYYMYFFWRPSWTLRSTLTWRPPWGSCTSPPPRRLLSLATIRRLLIQCGVPQSGRLQSGSTVTLSTSNKISTEMNIQKFNLTILSTM